MWFTGVLLPLSALVSRFTGQWVLFVVSGVVVLLKFGVVVVLSRVGAGVHGFGMAVCACMCVARVRLWGVMSGQAGPWRRAV